MEADRRKLRPPWPWRGVLFAAGWAACDRRRTLRPHLRAFRGGKALLMDLCRDEDHVYVKIIDYKSGTTSFDLAALFYGLQLQLVVYMDAAVEMEERRHPDKAYLL